MRAKRPVAQGSRSQGVLDPLERAVVAELERDPRISNKDIADRLDLTLAQVMARIRKIEKNDIAHVVAVLNLAALGQSVAMFRLTVQGRTVDDVAHDVAAVPGISWLAGVSGGRYDLVGSMRHNAGSMMLKDTLRKLYAVPGVVTTEVNLRLESLAFQNHFIGFSGRMPDDDDSIRAAEEALAADISDIVPDQLDRNIITELTHNGRISSRELARKYDVNAGTIRYRIRGLESRGIISLKTLVDPTSVGLHCFALVHMQVEGAHFDTVVHKLKDREWLPSVDLVSGQGNLFCLMLASSVHHAHDLLAREIRPLPGVSVLDFDVMRRNYKVDSRYA